MVDSQNLIEHLPSDLPIAEQFKKSVLESSSQEGKFNEAQVISILDISFNNSRDRKGKIQIFQRITEPYLDMTMQSEAISEYSVISRDFLLEKHTPVSEYRNFLSHDLRKHIEGVSDTAVSELPRKTLDLDKKRFNYHRALEFVGKKYLGWDQFDVASFLRDEYLRKNGAEIFEITENINLAKVTFFDRHDLKTKTNYVLTLGIETYEDNPRFPHFDMPIGYHSLLQDNDDIRGDQVFASMLSQKLRKLYPSISPAINIGYFGSFHTGYALGELVIPGADIMRHVEKEGLNLNTFIKEVVKEIQESVREWKENESTTGFKNPNG